MKRILAFWAIAAATSCSAIEPVSESEQMVKNFSLTTKEAVHPLLTFDIVPIPVAGVAEEITGDIKVLRKSEGWVPLLKGTEIGNGSKLQFGVGSRLRILFAPDERAELKSSDKERWVVFELAAPR